MLNVKIHHPFTVEYILAADPCTYFQQDFKNDKEYLSAEMRQMLLTGKVNDI